MLAFNDSFYVLYLCLVALVPLVLLFHKPAASPPGEVQAAH